jgi:HAD superfamily hydrolase (TIGR01484 family)
MFATDHEKAALKEFIIQGILNGTISFAFDMDQTCANDEPGNHDRLPVNQELTDIFNYLADSTSGAVAILTGRPVKYLETVMPEFTGVWATENGAMIRVHGKVIHTHNGDNIDDVKETFMQDCIDYLKAEIIAEGNPDGLNLDALSVEDHKEKTLTLQFTGVCDDLEVRKRFAQRLVALALTLLERDTLKHYSQKNQVVQDNSYVEVLPIDLDKGVGLSIILQLEQFQGKAIIYAGDSRSADKSAMIIARGTGGKGVGVTNDAPDLCDIRFSDFREHVAFWADIVDTLKAMEYAPHYATLKM